MLQLLFTNAQKMFQIKQCRSQRNLHIDLQNTTNHLTLIFNEIRSVVSLIRHQYVETQDIQMVYVHDVCVTAHHQYNDVNNQQDATTFSFNNLSKLALHVSGDKFAHLQEHFLTVYTAFGTMHRHCCRPVHCTKSCIYSQKVLLKMGEFVARNMQG